MNLSPRLRYQRDIDENGFQSDIAQTHAVEHLQDLYEALLQYRQPSWMEKSFVRLRAFLGAPLAVNPVRGLYFWGGVGRGKTYLMDTFFESLPFEAKMRTHFHRFMRGVHKELKSLHEQPDPLVIVAEKIAAKARIICFDEFFVVDITDAMILARLMDALFGRGVVLVATSNIEPSGLYKDGLQRDRFLPAINLIYRHTQVVNVDGGIDYRLRTLEQAKLYHWPLNEEAHDQLCAFFLDLVPDPNAICTDIGIEVEGRIIEVVKEAEDVIWSEFSAVCDGP